MVENVGLFAVAPPSNERGSEVPSQGAEASGETSEILLPDVTSETLEPLPPDVTGERFEASGETSFRQSFDSIEPEIRSRTGRGLLIALAIAGLLMLGIAAIILFGGNGDDPPSEPDEGSVAALHGTAEGATSASEPVREGLPEPASELADGELANERDAGEADATVVERVDARPAGALEKAEARAAPGKLYLHTNPWSKVRAGGRNLGTTPIVGATLPAGVHTLSLTDAEGRRHQRRARIRPGAATKLSFELRSD
jgi:hypothetical protein